MALLTDHCVNKAVIDNFVSQCRAFFALPRHEKEKFPEPEGYPPRCYAAVTTPEGKGP